MLVFAPERMGIRIRGEPGLREMGRGRVRLGYEY